MGMFFGTCNVRASIDRFIWYVEFKELVCGRFFLYVEY